MFCNSPGGPAAAGPRNLRGDFVRYWQALGSRVGEAVEPIAVPDAAEGIETRAVRIRPEMVRRIHPVDMNIVFQFVPSAEDPFDLIVGTNIFVYYGEFE